MSKPTRRTVYSSEPQLKRPRQFFEEMAIDLLQARELSWHLFIRNLQSQYRGSLLGYFWAFIPPLVTTLTWVLLNEARIVQVSGTQLPYPVFAVVGIFLWQGFVEAINAPLQELSGSKSMLSKLNLSHGGVVLAGLGEVCFNILMRMLFILVVFVFLRVPIPWTFSLAPIGFVAIVAFGATLGLFLVPIGMIYSDMGRAINVLTTFWFFITPVVYTLPEHTPLGVITELNPLSPLIVAGRDLMTVGLTSSAADALWPIMLTPILFLAGWTFYRLSMPHFIERLTAR